MENKKQTAVEWLCSQIYTIQVELEAGNNPLKNKIEQAKEMEKQQMLEFWNGGIDCTEEGGKSFEEYYNEQYKNQ